MKKTLMFIGITALLSACSQNQSTITNSGIEIKNFQEEVKGKRTNLFVLKNKNAMEVCVTNYGGRIVSVMVPDKNNQMRDVVLGFDSVDDYIKYPTCHGATIGRYANRIGKGKFTLDGVEYQLPQNAEGNCLHGGPEGFHFQVFDAKQINDNTLEMKYSSPDGEAGFPGNVVCKVIMKVTDDNAIDISYEGQTDKPTVLSMTNHSFFNLDGDPTKTIRDYELYVNADYFTPIDTTYLVTGELRPVAGTPFDFTIPAKLDDRLDVDHEQIHIAKGIDENWALNTKGDINKLCASVWSPESGIKLEVYTTEPGIEIYTANAFNGSVKGKKGISYNRQVALCFETQKYPDSPNHPEWPSTIVRPGETYRGHCIYKFTVVK